MASMADAVDRVVESEIVKNGYERTFRYACGYGDKSHQPGFCVWSKRRRSGSDNAESHHDSPDGRLGRDRMKNAESVNR
jgi:hypothetical protein